MIKEEGEVAYTTHNVLLPDGSQVYPGTPILADSQAAMGLMRSAGLLCPVTDEYTPTVIDLGCGDGGYAIEFARAGYDVVGVEARQESVDHCDWVRDQLQLDNLRFECADVRHFVTAETQFDIVCCLGLLYHLDYPVDFMCKIGPATRRLLLLNTHYSEKWDRSPGYAPPEYGLSDLVEHEDVQGRWYIEAPGGRWQSREQMEAAKLSSWGNVRSFWILHPFLLQLIQDVGFDVVFEQFDTLETINENPTFAERHWRGTFIGVKS